MLDTGVHEHKIRFGDMGASLGAIVALCVVFGVCLWMAFAGGEVLSVIGWAGAAFSLFALFFYPSIEAADVSDRIPQIHDLKKTDERFKDLSIKHQYFWIILIANVIFGATGIVWLALFIWAHIPGTVSIPPDVIAALADGQKNDGLSQSAGVNEPDNPERKVERELEQLKSLVNKGLISDEEAGERRRVILSKI